MNERNDRLIAAKQAIADKNKARGKGIGGAVGRDRLPPGQKLVTNDWPVLDLGVQPDIPLDSWQLKIWGACESPVVLDFRQLEKIGSVELTTDFHCVTAWSTFDNPWRGVPMHNVIELARPTPNATHLMFHSFDGYTTNVPLNDCLDEACLLVTHWQGRPLERKHGGPVRGMIPHLYAWKSAKWIKGVEFMAGDNPGFWEVRGYHMYGDPWKEERFG